MNYVHIIVAIQRNEGGNTYFEERGVSFVLFGIYSHTSWVQCHRC